MVETEFVRTMDDLGRICIPKNIREELDFRAGEQFQYFIDKENDILCIKKYEIKSEE